MSRYGYTDLMNADYVFEALLGYGMFSDKLPPCFSSEELLKYSKENCLENNFKNHAYIEYNSTRNTNVPRQLAIPHPESYWSICNSIKKNWSDINKHIGKPYIKFNYAHVRRIKGKKCIFEINYGGAERWDKEELILDYALGCRYVVTADISTFFPSVYAHSIPWAVKGKEWAKIHRCASWQNRSGNCQYNNQQPCAHEDCDLWPNDLDIISCSIKDGETNGILIGPHSSNIVSEIILSQVDHELQRQNFTKVIRHIDDFEYFAKDENDAKDFLRVLTLELKKYELSLNSKKTRIIPHKEHTSTHWISQLNQFSFPDRKSIGFTSISSYIDYALSLSHENNNFAALKYAIKVVSKMSLSDRAKRVYIKKILQIALDHPYIIPLLEEFVFTFAGGNYDFMDSFLTHLLDRSLVNGYADSLSFLFYFAIRFKITLGSFDFNKVISLNDCISSLLAYKYSEINSLPVNLFHEVAETILFYSERDQDKFWLFLYEVLPLDKLPDDFLKKLKTAGVNFYVL